MQHQTAAKAAATPLDPEAAEDPCAPMYEEAGARPDLVLEVLREYGVAVPKRMARFVNGDFPQSQEPDVRALYSRADGSPLVTNGTFSAGLNGWAVDAGILASVQNGQLVYARNNAGFGSAMVRQTIATQAGQTYRVQADVSANTQAAVFLVNGVQALTFTAATHAGGSRRRPCARAG